MVIRSSRKSDPRRSQKALIKKDRIIQLDLAFSLVAAAPQTEVSEWVWWVFCFCFFFVVALSLSFIYSLLSCSALREMMKYGKGMWEE